MENIFKKPYNKMSFKGIVINTVAFILMLFACDYGTGKLLHRLYKKQKNGWESWTKYSIEDTKADMILVGASRAQQQYNPLYFEDRLSVSCYNVGRDGQSFLYEYAVMQGIFKRYYPKFVILECERKMFIRSEQSYERLSCLLPFYEEHPEMREILLARSPFERVKLLSKSYPYNSLIFKIILANRSSISEINIKGYLPLNGSLNEPKRQVDFSEKYEIDSIKIKLFNRFIEQCKSAGVKLYFTVSPYYFNYTGQDLSLQIAEETASKNDIPFINLSKGVSELNDSKLYDDTVHVNQIGSGILTNIIIDSIIKRTNQFQR